MCSQGSGREDCSRQTVTLQCCEQPDPDSPVWFVSVTDMRQALKSMTFAEK